MYFGKTQKGIMKNFVFYLPHWNVWLWFWWHDGLKKKGIHAAQSEQPILYSCVGLNVNNAPC